MSYLKANPESDSAVELVSSNTYLQNKGSPKLFHHQVKEDYLPETRSNAMLEEEVNSVENTFDESTVPKEENSLNKSQDIESLLAVYRASASEKYQNPIVSSTICIRSFAARKIEGSEDQHFAARIGSLKKERHSNLRSSLQHSGSNEYQEQLVTSPIQAKKVAKPSKHADKSSFTPLRKPSTDGKVIKGSVNKTSQELDDILEATTAHDEIEKDQMKDLIVSAAITHERSPERKLIGRHVYRNQSQSYNNSITKAKKLANQLLGPEKGSSESASKQSKTGSTKGSATNTFGAKNAYRAITNIAKSNEKSVQRGVNGPVVNNRDSSTVTNKYYAHMEVIYKLSYANAIVSYPSPTQPMYKCYIGNGNNGFLIRNLIKTRWWWTCVDSPESADINFIWTELKKNNIVNTLKPKSRDNTISEKGTALVQVLSEKSGESTSDLADSDSEMQTSESSLGKANVKCASQKGSEEPNSEQDSSLAKLLTPTEHQKLESYIKRAKLSLFNAEKAEECIKQSFKSKELTIVQDCAKLKAYNHLEASYHLGNKKALYYNMRAYYQGTKEDVFDYLPLTFHICEGTQDKEYKHFLEYFTAREKEIQAQEAQINETADAAEKKAITSKRIRNIWILKPGEHTNRGHGIKVSSDLAQINDIINSTAKQTGANDKQRTYIVQQYIDRPLLYQKRKFDIRCYMLVTTINGCMKGTNLLHLYSPNYFILKVTGTKTGISGRAPKTLA